MSDDYSDDDSPEALLIARLKRQEEELSSYRYWYPLINQAYSDAINIINDIVEDMPEGCILSQISEVVDDLTFKSYLDNAARICDSYKFSWEATLIETKKLIEEANKNEQF